MSGELAKKLGALDEDAVLAGVQALKEQGVPGLDIIQELQEGMQAVGQKYEAKEYFLSELIMSAEIFNEAISALGDLSGTEQSHLGNFVLGTIYGDIHDIGKNIVSTVLKCNGFNVIDLGVDVPAEKFIEGIKEYKPKVIGFSCLLTTAFDNIKSAIEAIEKAGLRNELRILIGGGPVDQSVCDYVKADAVCRSAQEAVEVAQKFSA
ncbi:cobalamin B12-binding domain-containing protein [Desulfitobacterium chlororespirans]|uniref:Methanogenic corrinoid protein MtbC1 n=1 Tax=Desulfitobacterium chlororespirans DSM 11544 TaxID=1121395 RepID=A0A1M7UIW6_9FIRM|nr:cobalamin-dependent protein [Desulfitobacterium chlororespirans]SHN82963.1 Methanogenic corrinoid protein MtbC1 [Desulfitobacterium chlororespirans DSM 11544]